MDLFSADILLQNIISAVISIVQYPLVRALRTYCNHASISKIKNTIQTKKKFLAPAEEACIYKENGKDRLEEILEDHIKVITFTNNVVANYPSHISHQKIDDTTFQSSV